MILKAIHKDKEGNEMLISQMQDSHLLATIRLFSRRAAQILDRLNQGSHIKLQGALKYSLHFDEDELKEKLEEALLWNINRLVPYSFDAARRGLDISKELQAATGLVGVVEIFSLSIDTDEFMALPGSNFLE